MDENVVAVVSVITLFVLFPIVLGITRYLWKKSSEPSRPAISDDTSRRLMQMQQSIDAMAVELERISENQRFVTKLLAAREPAPPQIRGST